MPTTVEGIALLAIAVLPGALLVWSFERLAGRWGIGLGDRVLRFVGISVVFQVAVAPGTYLIWHEFLRSGAPGDGEKLPEWLWGVAWGYVVIPIAIGSFLGWAANQNYSWTRHIGITLPAPTAWDAVFGGEPGGYVLMRLKSGTWVGGKYTEGSYTGGYPEPADIFLRVECRVDQESGEFVMGKDGEPVMLGGDRNRYGLLVRWDEVEYLEVTPT